MAQSLQQVPLENPGSFVVHVVDDDEAVRDSLRALLESHGFEVRDYSSARAFLLGPPVQLRACMLLDVHMPGMSGLELLDALYARGSTLPVIAITGRGDSLLRERVVRAGALIMLDKPVADDTLLSSLLRALSLAECPAD